MSLIKIKIKITPKFRRFLNRIKRIPKKLTKIFYTIIWFIALPTVILNIFFYVPKFIEAGHVHVWEAIVSIVILWAGFTSLLIYIKLFKKLIGRIIHRIRGEKWHQCKYCGIWTYEPDYKCYKNKKNYSPITNY